MATIRVADVAELPPGKGKRLELGERQVTVFNLDGVYHAQVTRKGREHTPRTEHAAHGAIFEAWAEDSPARLRTGEEVPVRVEGDVVWLDLPE